jgi:hypothetical protein
MDSQKRLETIERLRAGLEQTKALYRGAKKEFELMREHPNDLGAARPNGNLRDATSVKTFTWRNYRRALDDFNRFVLDEKLPDYEK